MTETTSDFAHPCGARRPMMLDPGWECTGAGLVVITRHVLDGQSLPIVLPARALEIHDPQPWWDTPVVSFTGGDHLHLCVPIRPPIFPPTSLLIDARWNVANPIIDLKRHPRDFETWERL